VHKPLSWNLNHRDREEIFLCGLRGLCGSAVSAWLNKYKKSSAWSLYGNPQRKKKIYMKKIPKKKKAVSAEAIARKAEKGEDISSFFTNQGKMMGPVQRVNVDFTIEMLAEIDEAVRQMNISRQAFIKASIRQILDRRYLAHQARKAN
jgi:hypothetical protein